MRASLPASWQGAPGSLPQAELSAHAQVPPCPSLPGRAEPVGVAPPRPVSAGEPGGGALHVLRGALVLPPGRSRAGGTCSRPGLRARGRAWPGRGEERRGARSSSGSSLGGCSISTGSGSGTSGGAMKVKKGSSAAANGAAGAGAAAATAGLCSEDELLRKAAISPEDVLGLGKITSGESGGGRGQADAAAWRSRSGRRARGAASQPRRDCGEGAAGVGSPRQSLAGARRGSRGAEGLACPGKGRGVRPGCSLLAGPGGRGGNLANRAPRKRLLRAAVRRGAAEGEARRFGRLRGSLEGTGRFPFGARLEAGPKGVSPRPAAPHPP